jgi:hypothetical protein
MLFETMLTVFSWFMRSKSREANGYLESSRPDARHHQVSTKDAN